MRKIYYNGQIYTGESSNVVFVITKDNIIEKIGTTADLPDISTIDATTIDLEGKFMAPGFIDAHAHLFNAALQKSQLCLDFRQTRKEVLVSLQEYINEHPEKEVYYGIGYDESILKDIQDCKKLLDEIEAKKPIILQSAGGHESWVNSEALKRAGVDKNFKDPIPGFHYFRRDANYEPDGLLIENGPLEVVLSVSYPFGFSDTLTKCKEIMMEFAKAGVTSIVDCGIIPYCCETAFAVLDNLLETSTLKTRIFGSNFILTPKDLENWEGKLKTLSDKYNCDFCKYKTFKILNDGTIESKSAAMKKSYEDGTKVQPLFSGEFYYQLCLKAAAMGFDIHLHGIGDKAIHENLMAAREIRNAGFQNTKITNAHCQYVDRQDMELFAKYGVFANSTGIWCAYDESIKESIGERAYKCFPLNSLKKAGVLITNGSDFPSDEFGFEPLRSIETAVTRRIPEDADINLFVDQEECLSTDDMLKACTINAAKQIGMEYKIGTIEEGKYADLIVLSEDPRKVKPDKISKIEVIKTIMNGESTYERS